MMCVCVRMCMDLYVCVYMCVYICYSFSRSSVDKESSCNAGDLGLIPGLGRSPGEGTGNPLQYSCLENPHGQRRLAGYSPWCHKSQTRLSD